MATKLIKGINDLETWSKNNNPSIIEEWDSQRNLVELGLTIDNVHYSSHKKAYFKCKFCKETSLCNISDRSLKGSRCGKCANSCHTSYPEQLTYLIMADAVENIKNQHKIDGYEYDIYLPEQKLCIEYNSYWTHEHFGNGTEFIKNEICKRNGIRLITIKDSLNINDVKYDKYNDIYYYKESSDKLKKLYIICQHILKQYDIELNIENEKLIKIMTRAKENSLNKKNIKVSLLDIVPSITDEWDYEKNGCIRPEDVTYGSSVKYWFKCKNGHSYLAAPKNKSSKNPTGCKICHDTRVRNSELLKDKYPTLAIEYDICNKINISKITYGYTGRVKWVCPNCGFRFETTPNSRTYGKYGCRRCGYNWYKLALGLNQKIKSGFKFDENKVKEKYNGNNKPNNIQ